MADSSISTSKNGQVLMTKKVNGISFSGDGRIIASCSGGGHYIVDSIDNSVRLWDVQSGQQMKILEGHT
jgi:WD40 repeat protein